MQGGVKCRCAREKLRRVACCMSDLLSFKVPLLLEKSVKGSSVQWRSKRPMFMRSKSDLLLTARRKTCGNSSRRHFAMRKMTIPNRLAHKPKREAYRLEDRPLMVHSKNVIPVEERYGFHAACSLGRRGQVNYLPCRPKLQEQKQCQKQDCRKRLMPTGLESIRWILRRSAVPLFQHSDERRAQQASSLASRWGRSARSPPG